MNGYESRVIIKRKIRILVLHTKTKQNNGKQRNLIRDIYLTVLWGKKKAKQNSLRRIPVSLCEVEAHSVRGLQT